MNNVILIRYGELFLKGKNKSFFEKTLFNNIKDRLQDNICYLKKISGRYIVSGYETRDESSIIKILQKVFGIHSISPAKAINTNMTEIENYVGTLSLNSKSFRVTVKRADKSFPINSSEFASKLGGLILQNNPTLKVDLTNPEIDVNVEIREDGQTYIYSEIIKCLDGMPIGTAGKGLLLLSGGIDSPVAGFNIAKRGLTIEALHFQSIPYTSEQAKQKVLDLAKILSGYVGNIRVHICSFTKAQEAIHRYCNEEYMITIMRRIMMRVAERICIRDGLKTIITGESLGQVASQTIESITVTNNVVKSLPVLRPLIAMDKEEITEVARKINTFKTSILPYEDCCTVFLPDHPIIKPRLEKVLKEESKLDIDAIVEDCINNIEVVETDNL